MISTDARHRISDVLDRAAAAGRTALLETEALELAAAIGVRTPRALTVVEPGQVDEAAIAGFGCESVAVKVLAADVRHKTERGGVLRVPATVAGVRDALETLRSRFEGSTLEGFSIQAWIPHTTDVAGELLVSIRRTADFGPVVTVGPGGVWAETLAAGWRPGHALAIVSPDTPRCRLPAILDRSDPCRMLVEPHRNRPPRATRPALLGLVTTLLDAAADPLFETIAELELNPVVPVDGGWIALDGLATLAAAPEPAAAPRPTALLGPMLTPERIAIVGVSAGENPGRVILRNTLRAGFPAARIAIVKPGAESIDGCRCYPEIAALPWTVDLAVLAVAAEQVPDQVERWIETRKARSLIVIPGGLGERAGSEAHAETIRAAIEASRVEPSGGPVINGGNCLGIRSRPGRYDTLFLPPHKLPSALDRESPLAIVSQSGAFAAARLSSMETLSPRYVITVGNQIDLTLGDWLEQLERDPAVRVVACYVEGFRPGDGARWLRAAQRLTAAGRSVVLFRAGRTLAGAAASASHTASIAGDAEVSRELARHAGVLVAESVESFEDLVGLACGLDGRDDAGPRVAVLSNAGFECVIAADALGPLTPAPLDAATRTALAALLESAGLSSIVGVTNPLDITPMANDAQFVDAARLLLEDASVDVGVVGCVPLTPALRTLAPGPDHTEQVAAPGTVGTGLLRLWGATRTPWIVVIDGGSAYDALGAMLVSGGIPVFRRMDRALAALGRWVCRHAPPT